MFFIGCGQTCPGMPNAAHNLGGDHRLPRIAVLLKIV